MAKDSKYFIGIDIGTSSICGVLYDLVLKTFKSVTKVNDAIRKHHMTLKKLRIP